MLSHSRKKVSEFRAQINNQQARNSSRLLICTVEYYSIDLTSIKNYFCYTKYYLAYIFLHFTILDGTIHAKGV